MQFKYPELLWALFLLLIPIIIHLFQLRKFKVTPFTNLKFLQKVISKSRKSNQLKKWLLLATRMLLMAMLVLAFAQPYFANETALVEKETVIYLDDSFSMQARTTEGSLLSNAVQELIKVVPPESTFSLFTNTKTFRDITVKDIQNDLLSLPFTSQQLKLEEISLRANSLFTEQEHTIKDLILLSDFQKSMALESQDSIANRRTHYVQLTTTDKTNIGIDSVYISTITPEVLELDAELFSDAELKSTPVSLFNGDTLIAKTAATFDSNGKAVVTFSLARNKPIKGRIEISDTGLLYDNQFYFNIDERTKVKVLAIGNASSDYLSRIFTEDEFQLELYRPNALNYSRISEQNMVVLNELVSIPVALQNALRSFKTEGGTIIVIPPKSIDTASYNLFLPSFFGSIFQQEQPQMRKITNIAFSHPLFANVFEKRVSNFQPPTVASYYKIKTNASSLLSYDNGAPFLVGQDGTYIFTASIATENSNFKGWPLVVPIFYNMGVNSLKLPRLYEVLGNATQMDVAVKLPKDDILKVTQEAFEFIPQQRSFANKVSLRFSENPSYDGIFTIQNKTTDIQRISFNYPRNESDLTYLDMTAIGSENSKNSIASLFQSLENDAKVDELWKWFVIFAALFLVAEMLIQKYFK